MSKVIMIIFIFLGLLENKYYYSLNIKQLANKVLNTNKRFWLVKLRFVIQVKISVRKQHKQCGIGIFFVFDRTQHLNAY